MEGKHFDGLVRTLGSSTNRRGALGLLAAVAGLGLREVSAKAKHNRKENGRNRDKRKGAGKGKGKHRAKAQADSCWRAGACIVKKGANVSQCNMEGYTAPASLNCTGCNLSRANLRDATFQGTNLSRANLSNACLVDADFTDATFANNTNLSYATFCRTTMPDGSVNNSGCGNGTACCPTCNRDIGQSCGVAGQVCCGGAVCQGGTCGCPAGQTTCGDRCVNTQTDPSNCGGCGNACPERTGAHTPGCSAGACTLICDAGWADCNNNASDGCETPLGTPVNCLQCGDSCTHFADECNVPVCTASGCGAQPANEGQSCQGGAGTCGNGDCVPICIEALQPCVDGGAACCEGRTCQAFQPGCWGPRYCCKKSGEVCSNACDCCSTACAYFGGPTQPGTCL